MQRQPGFNDSAFGRWPILALMLVVGCLAAALVFLIQRRDTPATDSSHPAVPSQTSSPAAPVVKRSREKNPSRADSVVDAAWYDVPVDSLARRRAGLNELTAAHNQLPLGTLVRVTHLENGRSVTVRITDRGINDRRVKLDVCKEAADELDMVGKGIAQVRMEVIPEEDTDAPPEPSAGAP